MNAATWTPATDPVTLSRASASEGDFGPWRVYFYDVDTREELGDHPLHGMYWSGSGPMVAHEGAYVDGTAKEIRGCAYLDGGPKRVVVTAESFPGRRVAAKVWGGSRNVDWRLLAKGDESAVVGKQPRFDGKTFAAMMQRGLAK